MNIICAPSGIVDIDRPGQGISDMAKAGFENVLLDLTQYCSPTELENVGKQLSSRGKGLLQHPVERRQSPTEKLLQGLERLLQSCAKANLATPIALAPHLKRDTKRTDAKELLTSLALESLQICGKAGVKHLVVRPLPVQGTAEESWEENRAFYLSLADCARENNVTILLENQCLDRNGHLVRGICAQATEAARWVDSLNRAAGEERFGFCMNVGTYNLCGQSMREVAVELESRVKAVLLRDCNGQQETSMLPFTVVCGRQSQTDWLGLIRGLRESGFDGELVLDLSDTATVFSPILRPQLLALAKAVAEYFKWQIGIENTLKKHGSIVLFGAGNMCRNYMKCYGGKYPPLFTCDNNSALWGTTFCGLEVKAPESLAHLPADCAVFICNIYYREIEKQLREMGITNPIEFFNDEYMPSFYFDRLQRD